MALIPLKFTLKNYQQTKGLKRKIQASLVSEYFKTVLLAEFGKSVEPMIKNITLVGGSLRVSTDSSSFKQAISLHEDKFIKNINSNFKENIVKKITYKS